MKVYGAKICIDCRNYLAIQKKRGIKAEYIEITENTDNLRAFLRLRDQETIFETIRETGGIGIPLFIGDDGKMTFNIDEAFSWIGQKPVEEDEIEEKRKPEETAQSKISETWAEDNIAELDDWIESQGIYLRQ